LQLDVGNDSGGSEDDAVVEGVGRNGVELLAKPGDVVAYAEVVFFVCGGACLDDDGKFAVFKGDREEAFNGENVVASDAIVEDDAAKDFEVVRSGGDVVGSNLRL